MCATCRIFELVFDVKSIFTVYFDVTTIRLYMLDNSAATFMGKLCCHLIAVEFSQYKYSTVQYQPYTIDV